MIESHIVQPMKVGIDRIK